MLKKIIIICFLCCFVNQFNAQVLSANAGSYKTLCPNTGSSLGGSPAASGGLAPYTYIWSPSNFLNSSSISNPIISNITYDVWYSLTVIDKNNDTAISYVFIKLNIIKTFNAGPDTGYCFGQSGGVVLGASNNSTTSHSFSWIPPTGLDNATAANPIATPSVPTNYQLMVSDGICPNHFSTVKVIPFLPPFADAGNDTTIKEGTTITLNGKGAIKNYWVPSYNIKYETTLKPDVWPIVTTTYTLLTEDSHKCFNSDTVRITVELNDDLYFYSAFTPNADGDNDVFYIGNLAKYPDCVLKIYNRYNKLIYSATNYSNNWDGTYLGNNVPTGVYFYILDDGFGKKYKGTVTILR